jgi:Asp-tRNA(Asn)/Glu-tRNA(Gln) amidotransferase A subunit family amidase
MDSPGPLARTVGDVLMVYQAMRAVPLSPIAPARVRDLRIAVNDFNRDKLDGAEAARIEALLAVLRADGCVTEHVNHPYAPGGRVIMQQEFRPDLERCLARTNARRKTLAEIISFYNENPSAMPYGIYYLTEAQKPHDAAAYAEVLVERERLRAALSAELAAFDACLMTGATNVMHVAGFPSLALRLGEGADGLPQGLLLYGADERRLYTAALAIEGYCRPGASPVL